MFVELRDRCVGDVRWAKVDERGSARLEQSRRLVFKERLVRCYLPRLRRTVFAPESLQPLPPLPAELVVVPHADERPSGARILQVGIVKIVAIDRTVICDGGRNVEVLDLLTVRIAHDIAQSAIVHSLGTV